MKDICKNCGGWKGLHHYETNQCPIGGREAPIGELQQYSSQVFEQEDESAATIAAQSARIAELEALFAEAKVIIDEKNAKILDLKRNKGIDEMEKALGDCRIALSFYRKWMNESGESKCKYPFGILAEETARALLDKGE